MNEENYGWICPKCGRGCSPSIEFCSCESVPIDVEAEIEKTASVLATIFTDGSCIGNGGARAVSAWAFYCVETKFGDAGSGKFDGKSSNNTAELAGIFNALLYARENKYDMVEIHSDSKYCIDSLTKWNIESLVKGKKKQNYDQIKAIMALMQGFEIGAITFVHVKGHNGDRFNEWVDRLAYEKCCELAKLNPKSKRMNFKQKRSKKPCDHLTASCKCST